MINGYRLGNGIKLHLSFQRQ